MMFPSCHLGGNALNERKFVMRLNFMAQLLVLRARRRRYIRNESFKCVSRRRARRLPLEPERSANLVIPVRIDASPTLEVGSSDAQFQHFPELQRRPPDRVAVPAN